MFSIHLNVLFISGENSLTLEGENVLSGLRHQSGAATSAIQRDPSTLCHTGLLLKQNQNHQTRSVLFRRSPYLEKTESGCLLSSDQRSSSPPPSDSVLEPGKCAGAAVIVVSQPQGLFFRDLFFYSIWISKY